VKPSRALLGLLSGAGRLCTQRVHGLSETRRGGEVDARLRVMTMADGVGQGGEVGIEQVGNEWADGVAVALAQPRVRRLGW